MILHLELNGGIQHSVYGLGKYLELFICGLERKGKFRKIHMFSIWQAQVVHVVWV